MQDKKYGENLQEHRFYELQREIERLLVAFAEEDERMAYQDKDRIQLREKTYLDLYYEEKLMDAEELEDIRSCSEREPDFVAFGAQPQLCGGVEGPYDLQEEQARLLTSLAKLNEEMVKGGLQPDYLSLAKCYLLGLGTQVDYDFALALCQKMVRDEVEACAPELAYLCGQVVDSYADGELKQRFVQLTLPFCDRVAAEGNAQAASQLALLCETLQEEDELNTLPRLVPAEELMEQYEAWRSQQEPSSLAHSHGLLAYRGMGGYELSYGMYGEACRWQAQRLQQGANPGPEKVANLLEAKAERLGRILRAGQPGIMNSEGVKIYQRGQLPDKVYQVLLKEFDRNLPLDTIIGFFDESLFNDANCGLIFTTEGLYERDFGKALYVPYGAMDRLYLDGDDLRIPCGGKEIYISDVNYHTGALRQLLLDLAQAAQNFGPLLLKEAGPQRGL